MAPLSLHLRFQAAARALGFHLQLGQLLAGLGQPLLDLVAGRPAARSCACSLLGHLLAERAQFGGGQVQVERRFGGVALQQAVLAGEHDAQSGFHLGFEFAVALGLGGLPLERIHLAGDFFQDVEDARQILLGAFQLGFGQALAVLELGDAGGLFDHGAAVLRLGAEDLADAPLLDDGVAFRAEARAHEDVLDVAQAGGVAVDQVFAFARPVQAAGDGDFSGCLDGCVAIRRRWSCRAACPCRRRDPPASW